MCTCMVSFYFPFESVDVQNILPRCSLAGRHKIPQLVRVGSGGAFASPAIDSCTISAAASKRTWVSGFTASCASEDSPVEQVGERYE